MGADNCLAAADFYMSLYNVIFTVLPPLIIGMFDQDVDREMSRLYPGAILLIFHFMSSHQRLLSCCMGFGDTVA